MRRSRTARYAGGASHPQLGFRRVWDSTWGLATIASLAWWAAFPPLDISVLGWIAPGVWVYLICMDCLPGRRPYRTIWAVSALFWGLLLEGVGRAFWGNYFGLVLLGLYLGAYQVLFVWLTRKAVRQWRVPLLIAAPAVWVGLELARAHLVTGFGIAMLGHTQYRTTWVIQIADLLGAYTVSFVMVFVAACVVQAVVPKEQTRSHHVARWLPILAAVAMLACVFGYATARRSTGNLPETIKVALIQGTEDTVFQLQPDLEAASRRARETFMQYWSLTADVCERHPDLSLVVWPESVFSGDSPERLIEGEVIPPPETDYTAQEYAELLDYNIRVFHEKTQAVAARANDTGNPRGVRRDIYLLVGTDTIQYAKGQSRVFNSALLIAPSGEVASRYYKMHRVLLGEYIPFGDTFPALYGLLPIGRGLTPGNSPVSFALRGVQISPSICFESTVGHHLRQQFTQLKREGTAPQLLVNLTNDGWFWGSGILDLQLACAVFRAVELRRPMLVAANTGITAWIDNNGEIRQSLPRREEGFIVAEVQPSTQVSLYQQIGDAFAWTCLAGCILILSQAALVRCLPGIKQG